MEFNKPEITYFAAANGYGGFRDYFSTIFNPADYKRLYILKGGPGTGKSSLMKAICNEFQKKGYDCEAIFCSSDPSSLDGVIIKSGNTKVGILDGTAPHQTDAKIPGAIDEIINLGDSWNDEALISSREKILKTNKRKSRHYSEAYEYLNLAGSFFDKTKRTVGESYTGDDTKTINDILFDIPCKYQGRSESVNLISSFSKYGYKTENISERYHKGISVNGVFGSEYIFMERLLNESRNRDTEIIRFPSPFSNDITEAIYLESSDTLIIAGGNYENVIDTSVFLDECVLSLNKEKLNYYSNMREELLTRAQKEFSLASDAHFELEEIYSKSMDFSGINRLTENLILKLAISSLINKNKK